MITPDQIIGEVACITGVPVSAITGRRRKRRVAYARFLAVATIRAHWDFLTLMDIAHEIRCGEHTTIMYALKRHRELLITEPIYQSWQTDLTNALAS